MKFGIHFLQCIQRDFKGQCHENSMTFYDMRSCFRQKQWTTHGFKIFSIVCQKNWHVHRKIKRMQVRTTYKQTPQGYDIINVIYNSFDINGTNFLAITKSIHVYCSEQVIILITIYKLWHHNYLTWLRVFYILWLFFIRDQ